MTTSPRRAASVTVTGVAPVSCARAARVSGPLELATNTLWPSALKRRVSEPPMWPAPMMPIFIFAPFLTVTNCQRLTGEAQRGKGEAAPDCGLRISNCGMEEQKAEGSRENAGWKFVSGSPEGFICRERILALFALFMATFCLSEHPCGVRVAALSSSSLSTTVLSSFHVLFAKTNSPACIGDFLGYCVTDGCAGPGQRCDQRRGD